MKLVYKETKEVMDVTFNAYHYNPVKKVKEEGISVIVPKVRAYHYATLKDMFAEWEDVDTPAEETK